MSSTDCILYYLALTSHYSVPRKYLPGVLSRSCHGVAVCGAQLVLGGLLLMLAVWRMVLQVTLDSTKY